MENSLFFKIWIIVEATSKLPTILIFIFYEWQFIVAVCVFVSFFSSEIVVVAATIPITFGVVVRS